MNDSLSRLRSSFQEQFGRPPEAVARAPGRVNLIGEHTDYNDGFVLPAAINRDVTFAIAPRAGRLVRLYSLDFKHQVEFSLDSIAHDSRARWSNYVRGVALMLERDGQRLAGMDAALHGDVPRGSGLSSSAALEMASAVAFQAVSGFAMDGVKMARLCQKAENEFVGVPSGIMDQFASGLGRRDHALFLDCRTLDYRLVPIPPSVRLVVADTAVRRGLVDSEYRTRREQCEEAVRRLQAHLPGIRALRDVSPEEFEQFQMTLPEIIRRRARHVVYEDQRVLDAVAALEAGDVVKVGELMDASHASLRDDYQVSTAELDAMVQIARAVPGCLGARLTGAGFGGCTISLVEAGAVESVVRAIEDEYPRRTGKTPAVYVCEAVDGAELI